MESRVREGARKPCLSNNTVGWLLERATPRQLVAILSLWAMSFPREANRRNRLLHKAAFPTVKPIEDFAFAGIKVQRDMIR